MDAYCIDRINTLYCRLKAVVYGNADSKAVRSHACSESLKPCRRERTIDRNTVDYSAIRPQMFNR
jgi:hypothetical protein